MQIEQVCINNYRSAKNCDFNGAPLVCIIGENNAGKSTLLIAVSLFFSGSGITKGDYYDKTKEVSIEICFSDIDDRDLMRLTPEQADRVREMMVGDKLYLIRSYSLDGKSSLHSKKLLPKNEIYDTENLKEALVGKTGKSNVNAFMTERYPDHEIDLSIVTSQASARKWLEEYILSMPDSEKELKIAPLATGFDNSIKPLLPHHIFITAVKDFKDDVKVKESTSFGKLLAILSSFLETSGEVKTILESFEKLNKLLNKTEDEDGTINDTRIEQVKSIENKLTSILQENFPQVSIDIEIPKPDLKQVLSNATIAINDGVTGPIDTKGDGLKRAITFAILRTYVELQRTVRKVDTAEDPSKAKPQPYLFLFEEPELYLHPNAQKILFEALERLSEDDNQVIVTTHSPIFFSPDSTGTFIKARKMRGSTGKPFAELSKIRFKDDQPAKDAFQIICYENNAAAFFSDHVLLVEGDCDYIYIRGVSKAIESNWNFDKANIPVIRIDGKHNVKRYKAFFESFGIKVSVLLDADAMFDGFNKLGLSERFNTMRSSLISRIDSILDTENIESKFDRADIKMLTNSYSWREKYERLKILAKKIKDGETITDDESIEIDLLFPEEQDSARVKVFTDNSRNIREKKTLLKELQKEGIYILGEGAIEKYYPSSMGPLDRSDKPTKALKAVETLKLNPNALQDLPKYKEDNDDDTCELTEIFASIFKAGAVVTVTSI